ncbi:MAG: DUF1631 family protein [Rubrivivax sp.]|nr:DUF1631 family protein [Rubrivivax sp.]
MALSPVSQLFQQFVEDELLRAPLLFDQLLDAVADEVRNGLPAMPTPQRTAVADLVQALPVQRLRMGDYFMHSLREQVQTELSRQAPKPDKKPDKPKTLALVDEEEVAIDVELSHTIEAIKSVAEYELRELQTFTSAMVGDLEMARDHNPFRAETWARAVWNSAQALPLSRGHQVAFMRHASKPLAQLLRTSYAATTSRLEGMGVEPAAYRTLILPSGSRRGGRSVETTYTPDLYRMSETMPAPLDTASGVSLNSPQRQPTGRENWREVARGTTQRADRQAIELVSRLFEAMLADNRVPQDVTVLISRLHGPAMRLALRDRTLLDQGKHPLWRFVNQLVFAAEMSPDAADPERVMLLRLAQATIDQLASEPVQNSGLYRWALERLDAFLHKRLTRRLASVATQVGSLQKLEDKLGDNPGPPSTMSGPLDFHQLDTVPAEFMETVPPTPQPGNSAADWLNGLRAGNWVRMFFKGRWLQAQLLWTGERREFLLFGDGASDDNWAVRSGALLMMHGNGLIKTLKQRSIVGSAAAKVQEQVGAANAA